VLASTRARPISGRPASQFIWRWITSGSMSHSDSDSIGRLLSAISLTACSTCAWLLR
jgi:hypothetical protein